jgi:dienelactone hydrolase
MYRMTAPLRRRIAPAALVLTVAWGCGTGGSGGEVGEWSVGATVTTSVAPITAPTSPTTSPVTGTTETTATSPSSTATTAVSSTTAAPSTTVAPPSTAVDEGAVAWTTIDIVDATRSTDEVLGPHGVVLLTASPTRTIPTVLLYPGRDGGGEGAAPAQVGPRPLVVWLNGLGGRATAGDPLLLALYEAGYIVAAPNTPEIAAPVGHAGGYVHLPDDTSAVIDALIRPDDGVADELAAIVAPRRIGVVGHSIGGSGVYGVAFHDCCRDDRISAAAVFAPPRFDFEGGDFQFSGLPLLIIHGSADHIIALDQSESARDRAENALLVVLTEADHFQPVYGNERPDVLALSEALLTTFLDVHLAGVANLDELDAILARYAERISVR